MFLIFMMTNQKKEALVKTLRVHKSLSFEP